MEFSQIFLPYNNIPECKDADGLLLLFQEDNHNNTPDLLDILFLLMPLSLGSNNPIYTAYKCLQLWFRPHSSTHPLGTPHKE